MNPQQRQTLAALADVLIPAGDGMPSASQAGAAEHLLDEVLVALPEATEPLTALLNAVAGEAPRAVVERLQVADLPAFELLCNVVAGGYFLSPEVRRAIGYPGQQAVPIVAEDPPDYEQNGLLASVVARGPIYRPTPGTNT